MKQHTAMEDAWHAHFRQPIWKKLERVKRSLTRAGKWYPGCDLAKHLREKKRGFQKVVGKQVNSAVNIRSSSGSSSVLRRCGPDRGGRCSCEAAGQWNGGCRDGDVAPGSLT